MKLAWTTVSLTSFWFACDEPRRGVENMTHSLLESIHTIPDKGSSHICILLVDFWQAFKQSSCKLPVSHEQQVLLLGEFLRNGACSSMSVTSSHSRNRHLLLNMINTHQTIWQHQAPAWRDSCSDVPLTFKTTYWIQLSICHHTFRQSLRHCLPNQAFPSSDSGGG